MKTVLAISSGGGHWVQLQRLKSSFIKYNVIYCSTIDYSRSLNKDEKFIQVQDANKDDKIKLFFMFINILWVVLKVRPDIVISTGAAPGFAAILFSKLIFNSKTIWVDSIANVKEPSLAGLKVKRWADIWLTQWDAVSKKYGMEYKGSIL
jgi:UDP-N-acetylglucosamine:LPS N-acetylglucosamine transferase